MLAPVAVDRRTRPASWEGDPTTAAPPQPERGERRLRVRWPIAIALVVTGVVWLVAVSIDPRPPQVFVHTTEGLMLVDPADGKVTASANGGVASPNGDVLVFTRPAADDTQVIAIASATGEPLWSRQVPGDLSVRLVGQGGHAAVLMPKGDNSTVYAPAGRLKTTIVVAQQDSHRTYTSYGNLEPEALSLDNGSLFVVKFTPPEDPETYQVRRLDLSSGEVVDVYTPDEHLQQSMGGTARTQAWSPDGRRLYTLYTLTGKDGSSSAFVHVLALDELWAHCIDLDDAFVGDPERTALAVSKDGRRLFVADGAAARTAAIDTQTLRPLRVAAGRSAVEGRKLVAATGDEGRLFVATGPTLRTYDDAMESVATFVAPREIAGVWGAPGGTVYVALPRRLLQVDPISGERLRTVPLPYDAFAQGLGPAPPNLAQQRQDLLCAC